MCPADLLTWPDLREAEAAASAADQAWRKAQRAYWMAPHGRRRQRLSDLQEASNAALRAGLQLADLRRELGA